MCQSLYIANESSLYKVLSHKDIFSHQILQSNQMTGRQGILGAKLNFAVSNQNCLTLVLKYYCKIQYCRKGV